MRYENAFEVEFDAWLQLVAGERENPCPGEEAYHALRVAVACDQGVRERRPVRIEEVVVDAA